MTDSLTASVVKTLFSEELQKIKHFQYGPHLIAPAHFVVLATRIHFFGTIAIKHSSTQSSPGQYLSDKNELWFNFKKAETLPERAVVVHEATHAILDMNKAYLSVGDTETMAYVAQCQYARANNEEQGNRLEMRDHEGNLIPEEDDVFRFGWDIAGTLLSGGTPSQADYQQLKNAVIGHPNYSENYAMQAKNDGIYAVG